MVYRPRKATPSVEYYTRKGKKIGRPREDEAIYALLTEEFQLVSQIQERWPVQPAPMWGTINKRLYRAMKRYPKLIEHVVRRGWRRKIRSES